MATLDVITLAEAKVALDINDSSHDAELLAYITAASLLLDREFGPIVQRSVASERHSGGYTSIVTNLRPVAAVTTLNEYILGVVRALAAETLSTLQTYGFLAEPYAVDPTFLSGVITRRSGGYTVPFAWGRDNIEIAYTAGRFANTGAVDGRFKTAAVICLQNLFRSRQISTGQLNEYDTPLASFPKFALPNAVVDLLAGERQFHRALA